MGRKKKEVVEVKPEPNVFEYGDLAVICKCGRTQIIHKGVRHGLQILLATRDDSNLQLICDECNAELKLCFLRGEKPAEEVEKLELKNEDIQEEGKQE